MIILCRRLGGKSHSNERYTDVASSVWLFGRSVLFGARYSICCNAVDWRSHPIFHHNWTLSYLPAASLQRFGENVIENDSQDEYNIVTLRLSLTGPSVKIIEFCGKSARVLLKRKVETWISDDRPSGGEGICRDCRSHHTNPSYIESIRSYRSCCYAIRGRSSVF